jgi:hypothetical protein
MILRSVNEHDLIVVPRSREATASPSQMALCSVDEHALIVVPQSGHPGHGLR